MSVCHGYHRSQDGCLRLLGCHGQRLCLPASCHLGMQALRRPLWSCSLQSPGPPFTPEDSSGPKPTARIVMIRHGATYSTEDGLLLGRKDEALTPLGEVQANKTAELLMDMKVGHQQRGAPCSQCRCLHSKQQGTADSEPTANAGDCGMPVT